MFLSVYKCWCKCVCLHVFVGWVFLCFSVCVCMFVRGVCVRVCSRGHGVKGRTCVSECRVFSPPLQTPFSPQNPSWSSLVGPKPQGRWGGPLLVGPTSFLTSFVPYLSGPPTSPHSTSLAFVFLLFSFFILLCFFLLLFLTSSFLFQKKRKGLCSLKT